MINIVPLTVQIHVLSQTSNAKLCKIISISFVLFPMAPAYSNVFEPDVICSQKSWFLTCKARYRCNKRMHLCFPASVHIYKFYPGNVGTCWFLFAKNKGRGGGGGDLGGGTPI